MANKGFLRDWKWFWDNGSANAKNPNSVNKTSRYNLTIQEAKDNYLLDEDIIDNTLPSNEMIAHDSIKFVKFYGGVDGSVNDLACDRNFLYVAGVFNKVNNYPSKNLVRLKTITGVNYDPPVLVDQDFKVGSGFNGPVETCCLVRNVHTNQGVKLYVGGSFTSYNGIPCNNIVCLNLDGTINTNFNIGTGFNGTVTCIRQHPDANNGNTSIYVAGNFTTYKGVSRPYIVRLLDNGNIDYGFTQTNFPGVILDINFFWVDAVSNDRYYIAIGGQFNYTDTRGRVCNNLVFTELNGTDFNNIKSQTGWSPAWIFDGPVSKISIEYYANGTTCKNLIISGDFTKINNVSRVGFAKFTYRGFFTNHTYFNCNDGGYGGDVISYINETNSNTLILGGSFNSITTKNNTKYNLNNICHIIDQNSTQISDGGNIGLGAWGGSINRIIGNINNTMIYIGGSFKETTTGTKTGALMFLKINGSTQFPVAETVSEDRFNPDNAY